MNLHPSHDYCGVGPQRNHGDMSNGKVDNGTGVAEEDCRDKVPMTEFTKTIDGVQTTTTTSSTIDTADGEEEVMVAVVAADGKKKQNGGQGGRHEGRREEPIDPTASPPSELGAKQPQQQGEAYSVFTVKQKRLIVLAASLAGFFSPLSGSIYYPALDTIALDLGISSAKVTLTVTTYMVS